MLQQQFFSCGPGRRRRARACPNATYERMNPCPEGFLVIGDALCHFNPIYAQGMSAAAKQAGILQELLSDCAKQSHGLGGITSSFFAQAAEFNGTPWNLAAGADFAFPHPRRTPTWDGGAGAVLRGVGQACAGRLGCPTPYDGSLSPRSASFGITAGAVA